MARFTIKTKITKTVLLALVLGFATSVGAFAATSTPASVIPERVLGKADAPITVEEFVSLTCSHCAAFYNDTLPELEKKYVDTGKVKFILRDFPLDGTALRAEALARCMPEDQFYPFVKTLYKSQKDWAFSENAEKIMIQYARLGGLSEEKAKSCIADDKMIDAIVAARTDATQKFNIEATPTFIINGGVETVKGQGDIPTFTKIFDRLLASKK